MTLGAALLPAIDALSAQVAGLATAPVRAAAADLAAQAGALGPVRDGLAAKAARLAAVLADLGLTATAPAGPDALAAVAAALGVDAAGLGSASDAQDATAAGIAAALAALRAQAAALDAPPSPPPPPPRKPEGLRSGLPWLSGQRHVDATAAPCWAAVQAFEAYRGRPLDFELLFCGSYQGVTSDQIQPYSLGSRGVASTLAANSVSAVLTVPMFGDAGLPAGKQRFLDVVAGKHDGWHRRVCAAALASGVRLPVVRLGWEADCASYPWSIQNAEGDPATFAAAHEHLYAIYRQALPGVLTEINWLRNRQGSFANLDPWVPPSADILGFDLYGNADAVGTPAGTQAFLTAGTPWSPGGAWEAAAMARRLGRLFSVAEWAVTNPKAPGGLRDSATYIQGMFEFFKANSDILVHESYFNCLDTSTGDHRVLPADFNPAASAAYRACYAVPTPPS